MRSYFFLIPILLAFAPLAANEDPFTPVRDALRDGSGTGAALSRLEGLDGDSGLSYEGSEAFYEIEYNRLKGRILLEEKKKEEARAALEQSLALAERENGREETPRTLFFLASAGFLMASLDGFQAVVARSGELNDLVERGLMLDGNDPQLLLQKAGSLAYPPRLFGGDPEKAISLIEDAMEYGSPEKPFLFDLLAVLSHCYDRENRKREALEAAEQALALYPGNQDMIEKRDILKKKVKSR